MPLIEVRIVEAWLNGSLVDASTPFDGDVGTVTLKRTFDDVGSVHASPGTLLYLILTTARRRCALRRPACLDGACFRRLERPGRIRVDFGDGSALLRPVAWHAYDEPGNYIITLTVRDAYLTGDVTQAQFTVVIDAPPEVTLIDLPDEFIVGINAIIDAEVALRRSTRTALCAAMKTSTTVPWRSAMSCSNSAFLPSGNGPRSRR